MQTKSNIFDAVAERGSSWHRNRHESYALRIVTTLEWAIAASVPFPDALEVLYRDIRPHPLILPSGFLLFAGVPLFITAIVVHAFMFPLGCLYYGFAGRGLGAGVAKLATLIFVLWSPFYYRRYRWGRHIRRMANDLRSGLSLADVLKHKRMRGFPQNLISLIRDAEAYGRMEVVIPLVARQMRYESAVRSDRTSYWAIACVQVLAILYIIWGLTLFIVPIFADMGKDFLGRDFPASRIEASLALLLHVRQVVTYALSTGCFIFVLTRAERIKDRLMQCVPIVRTDWKRRQLRQLAQSVALYLQCGHDVIAAIQASLPTVRDSQLQERLVKFLGRVRAGEPWARAWDGMNLDAYAYPWLIVNAAHREDPLTGFKTMADWLHGDISRTTRLVQRWFQPCVVIAMSTVVGTIAYAFYSCFVGMWQVYF